MLYGNIENGKWIQQKALSQALDFLRNDATSLDPGRYALKDGVFAVIKDYAPSAGEELRFETHVQYADLHVMIAGVEEIFFAALDGQAVLEDKLADSDIRFHADPPPEMQRCIKLMPGEYLLLLPADLHKPECFGGSKQVRKCVIKIPVELLA